MLRNFVNFLPEQGSFDFAQDDKTRAEADEGGAQGDEADERTGEDARASIVLN